MNSEDSVWQHIVASSVTSQPSARRFAGRSRCALRYPGLGRGSKSKPFAIDSTSATMRFCHHRGDIINKCARLGHLLVAVALALDFGNVTITFHHLLQSGFLRLEVVGNTSDDLLLLLTLGLELIVLVH